jgi:hypothetical protein
VRSERFQGTVEPVTGPGLVADFLSMRLKRRPRMVGRILRMEGIPESPSREQLEGYASRRAMVIIQPDREVVVEAE